MTVTNIPMMNPEIVTGIAMMLLFVFIGGLFGKTGTLGFATLTIAHVTFELPYVILNIMPKYTYDKNIVDRFEFVLVFSKSPVLTIKQDITKIADYKNSKINGGLFWNINRKAGSVGKKFIHPAIYPNELVGRILDITTNKYQTVLDPFLGSGTTVVSAIERDRNSIGFEYNEGFKQLILSRIQNEVGKCIFNLTI